MAFPAILAAINFIGLHGHPHFGVSRLKPLVLTQTWFDSLTGHAPQAAPDLGPGLDGSVGLPLGRMIRVFFPIMTRGLSPVFALLLFGGMWGWRRTWVRGDQQPLFYASLAILAGIWIDLWYVQGSCTRYALPIVLMSTPFAALGLLGLTDRLRRMAETEKVSGTFYGTYRKRFLAPFSVAMPLLVVALGGASDLLLANYNYRGVERRLGQWICQEVGPSHAIVGPDGLTRSVSYYAQAQCGPMFPLDPTDEAIAEAFEKAKPDILLLLVTSHMQPDRFATLIDRFEKQGMKRTDPGRLPAGCERMQVLVRAQEKAGKGDRSNLCEAPGTDRRLVGPFRRAPTEGWSGTVPFFL